MRASLASLLLLAVFAGAYGADRADDVPLLSRVGDLSRDDEKIRAEAVEDLAEAGADVVAPLLAMMAGENHDAAACARFALDALAHDAAAPRGSRDRREAVAMALLAGARDRRLPLTVRHYALRAVSSVGGAECVPGLAKMLSDPRMGEIARWALARIPAPEATEALVVALAWAGPELKVGLINALGERADPAAVPALISACSDGSPGVRIAAAEALSNVSAPEAEAALWKVTRADCAQFRARAEHAVLEYASVLLEAGRAVQAEAIYLRLYGTAGSPQDRCAALGGYAAAGKVAAVPVLMQAVRSGPEDLRGASKHVLAGLDSRDLTSTVAQAIGGARKEARLALLWVLGERGGEEAVSALCAALRLPDDDVQVAALQALGRLADPSSVEPILVALRRGSDPVRGAAEEALNRIPGEGAAAAIAGSVSYTSPQARVVLVRQLGRRSSPAVLPSLVAALTDPGKDVRKEAIPALGRQGSAEAAIALVGPAGSTQQDERDLARAALTGMRSKPATEAIIAQIKSAPDAARVTLVAALAARGDRALRDLLVEYTRDANEDVAVAALDGLGRLQRPETAGRLLELARTGKDKAKLAALRAYLSVGQSVQATDAMAALRMYHQALVLGQGEEEQRLALERIATVASMESLPLVAPRLESESPVVRKAAAGALVPIASRLAAEGKKAEAIDLITGAIGLVDDREIVREAATEMRRLGINLDVAGKNGYVSEYWVLGPVGSRADLRKGDAFDVTGPVDVTLTVDANKQTHQWEYAPVDDPSGLLDLERAAARQDHVGAYAYAEVISDAERDVLLKIGSDDDVYCWLNGQQVHQFVGDRGWTQDQDTVEAHLKAGTNTVLCKVLQGAAQWSVSVRITDREGNPVPLKQWSFTPTQLAAAAGFVTDFRMLGPLPGQGDLAKTDAFPVQAPIDFAQSVEYKTESYRWSSVQVPGSDGHLNLHALLGQKDDIGMYLYAEIVAEKAGEALFKIGSDDGIVCWLNGEKVHENIGPRAWAVDADAVTVKLKAGTNGVLLKLLQGGGLYGVSLRVTDPEGRPMVLKQGAM